MRRLTGKQAGVPFIVANELAERYSYYGMQTILYLYLTAFMLPRFSEEAGKFWAHLFFALAYTTPLLGAFLSDIYWGKYKTIIRLSLGYVLGHFLLAIWPSPWGFLLGCSLIAVGSGGIKPNVSTMFGDQLPGAGASVLERYYSYFYLAVNTGAFIAFLSAESLLRHAGHVWAFGLPGLLMALSLVIFYLGRKQYVQVKPMGWAIYRKKLFSPGGRKLLWRLLLVYLFISVFWSLFDQNATTLVDIARAMNGKFQIGQWSFSILPTQWRAFNTLFILILVPVFSTLLFPWLRRITGLSYSRKVFLGMALAVLSFLVVGLAQEKADLGQVPSGWYLIGCYVLLTAAEIFISVTALEFSYALAPAGTKAFIMSFYSLSIAFGNLITAGINGLLQWSEVELSDAAYIWLFMGMMLLTTVIFGLIGKKLMPEVERIDAYEKSNIDIPKLTDNQLSPDRSK